ncbi:trypsin-like peptidase domain-containing protein [Candidatus Uhrbacteria bacterium]|nr:trypsin-like peptidase domain-containing protein [Candidatus Uhrbacteria bacterium]
MPRVFRYAIFSLAAAAVLAAPAALASPPAEVLRSAVFVICDTRQGTGVVTNAVDGYVVTNGHVVLGENGGSAPQTCQVGFTADGAGDPKSYFLATVEKVIFDAAKDLDFAVLKLGQRIAGPPAPIPTAVAVNEFAAPNDPITVFGFPGGGPLQQSAGVIKGWNRGIVETDAAISKGYSGSPAVDAQNRLIGIATRTRFTVDPATGAETVTYYELGDVLPLIAWLDSFEPRGHDRYLLHADPSRSHALPYVLRDEKPGCTYMVRTKISPTVYCLLVGERRLVFPNDATYRSWFTDFSEVLLASLEDIAKYRLSGNVTYKAGTLVKIQTDPRVYMVSDDIGTLRWVPTEARAIELFGAAWAAKVKDVPDAFFVNYGFGQPL